MLRLYCNEHIGDTDKSVFSDEPVPLGASSVRLKMETHYLERKLSFCYGEDEEKLFAVLGNVYYLCDEGLSRGKRFTGALVGMYAFAGDGNLTAKFVV